MVAVVYDKAGNNAFFRKSAGIKEPKDLIGKKIAVPPADSHRMQWPAFARINGIDPEKVTLVNVKPEGKQAIVAGNRVDAAFDLYTSFAIWEKVLGKGEVGHLTMPQILDLCATERSREHGLGWIEPELMQKTMDITFANNTPEKALKVEDVFTNDYSSRIKPLK